MSCALHCLALIAEASSMPSLCTFKGTLTHLSCWKSKSVIHTHTHTYIHTFIYTHTHTYIHTYIHIHTYTHIHTYIHSYTHIHTHLPCCKSKSVTSDKATFKVCDFRLSSPFPLLEFKVALLQVKDFESSIVASQRLRKLPCWKSQTLKVFDFQQGNFEFQQGKWGTQSATANSLFAEAN